MGKAEGSVGFEQFIETWEMSNSVQDVCEKLGITKQNAYARATKSVSYTHLTLPTT